MSSLRWTLESTYELARALQGKGFGISSTLVGELLRDMGYSLQGVAKQKEGIAHPGRDGPYGVLDVGANEGWVSVGDDADTAAFAANTVRSWWQLMGRGGAPGLVVLLHGRPLSCRLYLAVRPTPTSRQVASGGPPPQLPRLPGQPLFAVGIFFRVYQQIFAW